MVQFCPKCGTKEPDDQAVFCNRCGSRLPPPVPEKIENICPVCGTRAPDDQAVFCNKCGSPLHTVPPVLVRQVARPPAARPLPPRERCPSCGAPHADGISDFCNICGANLWGSGPSGAVGEMNRPYPVMPGAAAPQPQAAPPAPVRHAAAPARPVAASPAAVPPAAARPPADRPALTKVLCPSCGAPLEDENPDYCYSCGAYFKKSGPDGTAGESPRPAPEKPAPAHPVAESSSGIKEIPAEKKSRRPLLKWGLVSLVAVIVLIIIGASITGMIPGSNKSSNATPASELPLQGSTTAPTVQETPQADMPLMPTPVEEVTAPVPTPVKTTNASATTTTNASATTTTNASVKATKTLPITDPSRPLPIGQSAYDGKGNLTVTEVSFKDKMSDPIPSFAIGRQYLIVGITYENLQKNETVDADVALMKVTDGGGYAFEPVSDIMLENPYTGKTILPLEKRTGNLLFIVPPGATLLKLEYGSANQRRATLQLT